MRQLLRVSIKQTVAPLLAMKMWNSYNNGGVLLSEVAQMGKVIGIEI